MKCSYFYIPPAQSTGGKGIIGRNYDYPSPFDKIAKYLTLTYLNHPDFQPTLLIALPGQAYCPSCLNKWGLFVEINNGMPSGGYDVDPSKTTLLIKILEGL